MAGEGLPVQAATRVLAVTDSGYHAWRGRGPSARAVRHALVTETIRRVHPASRGTYGYRRVHAELTLGRGLVVGHGTVELLMARAGLKGVTGAPKWRRAPPGPAGHRPRRPALHARERGPAVGRRHHRASAP
jgi:hypothetical protein